MPGDEQRSPRVTELDSQPLTPHEARAIRLACIFGTPTPTPPEITSALRKIAAIEAKAVEAPGASLIPTSHPVPPPAHPPEKAY